MKSSKWMMMVFAALAAWILPSIASAQLPMPNPGAMIQLRADDPRCSEGSACFMVGEYRPGGVVRSFERMLEIVNRGRPEARHISMEQLDAANECGIMYVRGTGDARVFGANGTCSRNGTTERVTFESFCGESRVCARWPYANRVYRVPSVRILTPDERAEEMAREIANAVDTETVPAPASLGANLRELIELRRSSQPPTDEHEVAVLTAMANALDRAGGTSASTPAPVDMDFSVPDAEAATGAALADARTRIISLEQELATARAAIEGRWHWWITFVACLIGMFAMFFIGRWSAPRIRVEDEEAPNEPVVPRRELDEALERATVAEQSADSLRAWWLAIKEVFEKATGKSDPKPNEIGEFIQHAHDNVVVWNGSLKDLTPAQLREEREQAKLFRQMREEWQTTPGVDAAFTLNVRNVAKTLAAWWRLDTLTKAWSGMEPAFALSPTAPDGGLAAYLDGRVEREIEAVRLDEAEKRRELVAQRDGFERQLIEARREIKALIESPPPVAGDPGAEKRRALALVNERVGAKLDETLAEFGKIADGESVGIEEMRAELRLVKRQKVAPILDFLQRVLIGVTGARKELDVLLAPHETGEVVREPGRIYTPPRPSLPSVPPPPPDAEAHPDLFGEEGMAALGDTAEATPIAEEKTRFVKNPLLEAERAQSELPAENTNPFAEHPDFAGGNGTSRDDETTKVVHVDGNGRPRRNTHRGIGFAAAEPPPAPEPIAVPVAPPEGSPEGE